MPVDKMKLIYLFYKLNFKNIKRLFFNIHINFSIRINCINFVSYIKESINKL